METYNHSQRSPLPGEENIPSQDFKTHEILTSDGSKNEKPVYASGPQSRPTRALAEIGGEPPPPTPPPHPVAPKPATGKRGATTTPREKRLQPLKIRVTVSEEKQIKENVPLGETFSAWARKTLLAPNARPKNPELVVQIARIGNNLNQIARSVNSANARGTPFELLAIAISLQQIQKEILDLLKGGTEQ